MSASQKRKAGPDMYAENPGASPSKRQETDSAAELSNQSDGDVDHPNPKQTSGDAAETSTEPADSEQPVANPAPDAPPSRLSAQRARFAALQARQNESRKSNRKEATLEFKRASVNPHAINSLNRKKAVAEQKLARADAEAAGENYERKRAWDWTIEESEAWDRRMAKKSSHRDDVAFQSYGQDARKVYKRQLRELGGADVEGYEREKAEAVRQAADEGRLNLVEREDGEIVAVDREGNWFGGRESIDVIGKGKVDKDKVDKLVAELKKAEEVRLRKMRQRKGGDDEDVTYINDKNKQFNQKLARFYNKYTSDIRDSFERGTAI